MNDIEVSKSQESVDSQSNIANPSTSKRPRHPKQYKLCEVCQQVTIPKSFTYCSECKKKWVRCGFCGEFFDSKYTHEKHIQIHLKCAACLVEFQTLREVKQHHKDQTCGTVQQKPKGIKCSFCEKIFKRKEHCIGHENFRHKNIKEFQCQHCHKCFPLKKNLVAHLKSHSADMPFPCTICPAKFRMITNLKLHLRCHTGERPYQCHLCLKMFRFKASFSRHLLIHGNKKTFKCHWCEKRFVTKVHLKSHEVFHGVKAFGCFFCPRRFYKNCLRSVHHRLKHTMERPFACEHCPRTFAIRGYLAKHMLLHTGIKSHKCDICERSYYRKSYLVEHKKIHSVVKKVKFKCDVCKKDFSSNWILNYHMQSHAGRKHSKVVKGKKIVKKK